MGNWDLHAYRDRDIGQAGSTVRCQPVFVFPDMNNCQGFLYQPCNLEDLVELPNLSTDIFTDVSAPVEMGFEVPVICSWCGVVIRYITGFTQDGASHGMCEQCFNQQWSQKTG